MAIYACGILAGISAGYLIFSTTFGQERRAQGRQRPHLGLARSARRVHLRVGRRRDARVGAVRRLVAQRLRPRRPHHQPAAHGARRRLLRHRVRHRDADARVHESRERAAAAGARADVSVRRRHGAVRIAAHQARIDQPLRSTQRALLFRRLHRHAGDPCGAVDRVANGSGRARSSPPSTARSRWRSCGSCRCFRRSRSSDRCSARSRTSSRGNFRCC